MQFQNILNGIKIWLIFKLNNNFELIEKLNQLELSCYVGSLN
jgi:hypothetical protein